MDQNVVLETIQFLHNDMKERTLWAGINERRFSKIIKNTDLYTEEELQGLCDWLLNIWDNQYKVLVSIYRMVPAQNWENYVLLGITELQEQVLMEKAKKNLFDVWKDPYYPERKIIRKVKKNGKEKESSTEQENSAQCSSGSII